LEPILARIATDRSIVICPMIDAINDKTLEFSRQGGLAVGGFTWSLHFTWRSVPDHEQRRRKSEADPARFTSLRLSSASVGRKRAGGYRNFR